MTAEQKQEKPRWNRGQYQRVISCNSKSSYNAGWPHVRWKIVARVLVDRRSQRPGCIRVRFGFSPASQARHALFGHSAFALHHHLEGRILDVEDPAHVEREDARLVLGDQGLDFIRDLLGIGEEEPPLRPEDQQALECLVVGVLGRRMAGGRRLLVCGRSRRHLDWRTGWPSLSAIGRSPRRYPGACRRQARQGRPPAPIEIPFA